MPYSPALAVETLRSGTTAERDQLLDALESEVLADGVTALDALRYDWHAWARDEQLGPAGMTWRFLFQRAGRGGGKTRGAAEIVRAAAEDPASCGGKIALIAPTHGDIRIVMVEGESGILAISPPWAMPEWQPGYGHGGRLRWAGAPPATGVRTAAGDTVEALCFSVGSTASAERIRGPQFGLAWGDEIAAWGLRGQQAHDLLNAALRLGTMPRVVYTSTPKPTPFVERLDLEARREEAEVAAGTRDPRRRTYVQRIWSTFANAANLPAATVDELQRRYGGTTQGRQELEAELLLDDPDALWSQTLIDRAKVLAEDVPELVRIAVAVDIAGSVAMPGVIDGPSVQARNRDVGPSDTGIGAVGVGVDGEFYVLDDWTQSSLPGVWGKAAIDAFADAWQGQRANYIVVEKNYGGNLIKANLDVVMMTLGVNRDLVPIRYVNATDGKMVRADPVLTLYEKRRVHHVVRVQTAPGAIGRLVDLEYQMTRFKHGLTGIKKDRVDWLVWAITSLISGPQPEHDRAKAAARAKTYIT